jgi:HEAT repeat protein
VAEAEGLAGQLNRGAVQRLLEYLGDEHPFVGWRAGEALAETASRLRRRARLGAPIWDRKAPELTHSGLLLLLYQGLHDSDPTRRAATAEALGLWAHEAAVGYDIQALADADPSVRLSAAAALGKLRDKGAMDALMKALKDESLWVRRAAADALGAVGDPKAVSALQGALADPEPLVRAGAVCALGHLPTARARHLLQQAARNGDAVLRWCAARSLGQVGDMGALPALQRLQDDEGVFFGRPTADVATASIAAIRKRCLGPWNMIRRAFYTLRYRLESRR